MPRSGVEVRGGDSVNVSSLFSLATHIAFRRFVTAISVGSLVALLGCTLAAHRVGQDTGYDNRALLVGPFATVDQNSVNLEFGQSFAEDIVMELAQPSSRLKARLSPAERDAPNLLPARYALHGTIRVSEKEAQATAQLIDRSNGRNLWAGDPDLHEGGLAEVRHALLNKCYESIFGGTQLDAEINSSASSREYLLYLKGRQALTSEDTETARAIWSDALSKYPDSVPIKLGLANSYIRDVQAERSKNTAEDIEKAWALTWSARSEQMTRSTEVQWQSTMAYLYQWHEGDFPRSTMAARRAMALFPRDPSLLADLAEVLTYGGSPNEAIEWLKEAHRLQPSDSQKYVSSLAWAYLIADRPKEALKQYEKVPSACPLCMAVAHVRMGKLTQARAIVSEFRTQFPDYAIDDEEKWPGYLQPQMAEPFLTRYLEDLRKAGLPDS